MKNKKNLNKNLTDKIRSSLVLKLNFKMLGRLSLSFLKLNILIILLSSFLVLWNGERKAEGFVKEIERRPESFKYYYYDDIQISKISNSKGGLSFPSSLEKRLPVDIEGAIRNLVIENNDSNTGLLKKIDLLKYTIEFTIGDSIYIVEYYLGRSIRTFMYVFIIIVIYEIFIFLGNIKKGHRMIKRTLKPIDELTETAKNIQKEMKSSSDKYILDLAGKISNIDADKLDKEITVDSSQEELKELASAINHMLNRINNSYKSQVRFVSDASHELRTPISIIQGYVNLLDRWGKKDPKIMDEAISAIKTESENMKELIEKLLFLARSDNETIQLQQEVIDACDIVEEIVKETQLIDGNHEYGLELNRPAYINADKQLLKQAIRILIDNSIKFTPYGNKITLKVHKRDGEVCITVQDNGMGIKPENLPNLFDRFYRSDESRTKGTGGSGLGLSIAKWIIDRHGAYFEVLSRVNAGTRITMVFKETKLKEDIDYEKMDTN